MHAPENPGLAGHLAEVFGYHTFRPYQEAVVRAILTARDTFTVMPTGGGKSLCYQLPAKLLPGVCVVVSPLISLMKDQVDAALGTGLRAAAFNSAATARERDAVRAALKSGDLDLLYIAPERLRVPEFLAFLKTVRIAFFAIDEAHCISEWGHDFRPDYLALSALTAEFPGIPIAAFTATATARVEKDITARLNLRDPFCTRASFNRPNLFYQVTPKENLDAQLLDFLKNREDEPGIIYRTTRKDVEKTAAFLRAKGVDALPYHAGLGDGERARIQDAFRKDLCRVMVATIAFGMGIDKPNVRFVIHADLPKNLESYYQETGRAGRDGEKAWCALFYGRRDIAQLLRFAESVPDEDAREAAKTQVYRILDFTQKDGCRRKALLRYFGEEYPEDNCGCCDICTGAAEREDALQSAQKLLSAMVRTNCRFGAAHCINIVLGKETPRIRGCGHTELPTFGVGRDKDKAHWHRVMDAIIAQELAITPDPSFPIPEVTAKGWEVLRGQRPFAIVRLAENQRRTGRRARDLTDAPESPLFTILCEERSRIAREKNVPPYVVFADRSLREMATLLPDTPEKFLAVSGVGSHKLEAYGDIFLGLIKTYRAGHPSEAFIADAAHEDVSAREAAAVRGSPGRERAAKGETLRETEALLDSGLSAEAIAHERGRAMATILSHMEKLARQGKNFDAAKHMPLEKLDALRDLFERCASPLLTPVVEASREHPLFAPNGATYEEARLARILLGRGDERRDSGQ